MIHVNRHRVDKTDVPIRPDHRWFADARAARATALAEGDAHTADRSVYGHAKVRAALEELFHDKCAYCETKITGGDWDVDHFRPKGRVAERKDHPGYYWLAYEWTNLLPACAHCNQRRRDRPRWGARQYAETGGKRDQFPLRDESTRAMSPSSNLGTEEALLIDPCTDSPDAYLLFTSQGEVLSFDGSLRGQASIDVFHLNRRRLRDLRRETIEFVIQLLERVRDLEAKGDADGARKLRGVLNGNVLSDRWQYAAATRAATRDPAAFGF